MNQLKFIKPEKKDFVFKISTQKTGKIAFSKHLAIELNLFENRFLKIGSDSFNNIFIKSQKKSDEETFKISKRGVYYYLEYLELLTVLSVRKGETEKFEVKKDKDDFFKIIL